jgi:hypothetical protein
MVIRYNRTQEALALLSHAERADPEIAENAPATQDDDQERCEEALQNRSNSDPPDCPAGSDLLCDVPLQRSVPFLPVPASG